MSGELVSRSMVSLSLTVLAWAAVGCAGAPLFGSTPGPVPSDAAVEAARAAARGQEPRSEAEIESARSAAGVEPPGSEAEIEAARSATARGATATGSSCNYAPRESYWFCRALESRNCNWSGRNDYWFCRALVESQCNYAGRDQYWFCRALTEAKCNYAGRDQYWLCRALVENQCNYAGRDQYWFCRAIAPPLQALINRSSSSGPYSVPGGRGSATLARAATMVGGRSAAASPGLRVSLRQAPVLEFIAG